MLGAFTDQAGFHAWLNPTGLTINEQYAPDRLLHPANFVEITVESYDDMLNCMPPRNWVSHGFTICEAATSTHRNGGWTDIRLALYRINSRYFAAHVTDQPDGPEGFDKTAQRIAAWIAKAA